MIYDSDSDEDGEYVHDDNIQKQAKGKYSAEEAKKVKEISAGFTSALQKYQAKHTTKQKQARPEKRPGDAISVKEPTTLCSESYALYN